MKTIFVVDDSISNLVTARQALSGQYEVYTFSSADLMFEHLGHFVPDLILLDLLMPEINGFTAFRHLINDKRYRNIPVVIFTSKGDAATETLSYQVGAVDFIRKPFTEAVLLESMRRHIS